ncbi:agmatine deiminase family protein [Streptomyces sp. MST-110588]|uniref:agmatine deiminase family protein n=1 Tax=Streptomyces sp. MST-110588 TaxID=2833628 RepID=UPI001F5DD9B7|nr:agmatine deiminase family protein [Streptomyces sp. MST-110588]
MDFRINGWGGKQNHPRDGRAARTLLRHVGVPRIDARITGEGGAVEVDGAGTLLATESSLVNDNRNPGVTRVGIERALCRALGVTEVIWLAGVRTRGADGWRSSSCRSPARPGQDRWPGAGLPHFLPQLLRGERGRLMPRADDRAASIVRDLHPGRAVRQVTTDAIAEGVAASTVRPSSSR